MTTLNGSRTRRVFRLAFPPLAILGSIGALELARRHYQARRLFRPEPFPSGDWSASATGLRIEDVWFHTEDRVRLHGWWLPQPEAVGTILFCHGHSGSVAHRLETYRQLSGLRVNLFAFDYRGYGRSSGSPSEKGLFRDVRAAHDVLTDRLGEEARRIVLLGQSLGGAVAIDGALHRPVAGLIVQSSFTGIRAVARHSHQRLPVHWIARNEFHSLAKIPHVQGPKLIVHGTEDAVIPLEHGRTLFERAEEPKEFLAVPGAGHNDVLQRGGQPYLRRLSQFVQACLEP